MQLDIDNYKLKHIEDLNKIRNKLSKWFPV
jgi:hypothetical protein